MQEHHLERLFALDEGRFGLKVWLRRRWCPAGRRPPWIVEDHYEWVWVYVAVEPISGELVVLLLPHVDAACLQLFVDHLQQLLPCDERIGVLLDGSGSHTSGQIVWPEHLLPLRQPPYSPELNPAEQLFRHLRARLANQVFDSLEALEDALVREIRWLLEHPQQLSQLTAYPWWCDALRSPKVTVVS